MPEQSPLYPLLKSRGAKFREENGLLIPDALDIPAKEYQNALEQAALSDRSHYGKLRVTGSDRISLLHHVLTHNIASLSPHQGCQAALLTHQGKMLAWMEVLVLEDCVLLLTEPGHADKTKAHLEQLVITEDVAIEDITKESGLLFLWGPEARTAWEKISAATSLPEPSFAVREMHLGDCPVLASKFQQGNFSGWNIWIPSNRLEETAKKLLDSGNGWNIRFAGECAWEYARIAAGIPRYGKDMAGETILNETGLNQIAASATKGCYPGQEVVARIQTYDGLNRRLMVFAADAAGIKPGSRIFHAEQEAGIVKSAAVIDGLNPPAVFFGLIQKPHFKHRFSGSVEAAQERIPVRSI